jgi:hypothetical protein
MNRHREIKPSSVNIKVHANSQLQQTLVPHASRTNSSENRYKNGADALGRLDGVRINKTWKSGHSATTVQHGVHKDCSEEIHERPKCRDLIQETDRGNRWRLNH